MEYQEFSVYGKDMPGFNEMIAASKSFGHIRTGYNKYAVMKKTITARVVEEIEKANIYPIDKIFLHMIWIEPTKRRDPDNIAAFIKFILDALQKAKIIKNDGWGQVKGWKNNFIKGDSWFPQSSKRSSVF